MQTHQVIIFYKYVTLEKPAEVVAWLKKIGEQLGMTGRVLIAREGINGTLEGTPEQVEQFSVTLKSRPEFADMWIKASPSNGGSFKKLKVKERREIVATGLSPSQDVDPNQVTGKHISAEELKQWFEKGEKFHIIDMRNDYEYAVGHFAGSHNSHMENFRDLAKITPEFDKLKKEKVLTVCTYGVRCEKASGFLKTQGFEDVYQLHGGIGTYMKQYPGQDFEGSLYVFDDRMTEQFTPNYKVIGQCSQCQATTERFGNCARTECWKQLLICDACAAAPAFCSDTCKNSLNVV